jgi:glycosyltransferase involved in cell wall biosynthesis
MVESGKPHDAGKPYTMRVEGWRGVSHSLSLVNQWQILELLKMPNLRLFHRDAPFAYPNWERKTLTPGFSPEEQARIDALPDSGDEPIDCVYRVFSPYRAEPVPEGVTLLTYMVTEFGINEQSFVPGHDPRVLVRDNNLIVPPSNWARDRIIEFGFPEDRVHLIPHAVNTQAFFPMTATERAANRAALGLRDDEIVFVNCGAPTWNKGIDILIHAFAILRRSGLPVRLILKEQIGLYNRSSKDTISVAAAAHPELFTDDTIGAISLFSSSADLVQLRALYAIADAYVAPYRAEGFNLPVLEAIACGVPVITTAGGATDDFCSDEVALFIRGDHRTLPHDPRLRYIEPRLAELVAAMESIALGNALDPGRRVAAREAILENFTWERAAKLLVDLAQGDWKPKVDIPPVRPIILQASTGQRHLLSLLGKLRPLAMRDGRKVRLGRDFDGGYVLPDAALGCDMVVSIGVGHDVSFDLAFARRGARVLQFDHTVEVPPDSHPNCIFYKKGWGTKTEGDFLSFADILREMWRFKPRRALLKFDIEGGEYGLLPGIDRTLLADFAVIVCELHDFDRVIDPNVYASMAASFDALTADHAPVHVHANNYQAVIQFEGVTFPPVIEMAFLRRDLDVFPDFDDTPIPGPLDRPSRPLSPDISLSPFAGGGSRSLFIYCDGGLGNRINALISGLVTARLTGLAPIVVWPPNNWCRARYVDLFTTPLTVIEKELAEFARARHALQFLIVEDRLGLARRWISPLDIADTGRLNSVIAAEDFDVFYYTALIPPYITEEMTREQLRLLPFRPEYVAAAERFMSENGLSPDRFIGLHARRTDFGARGADLDALRKMVQEHPEAKFFVCSDDPEAERQLAASANVVVRRKADQVKRLVDGGWNEVITDSSGRLYPCNVDRGADAVREAVIDLLILSRSEIIPTSGSTFLSMARMLHSIG